jgi:hypothetical protein
MIALAPYRVGVDAGIALLFAFGRTRPGPVTAGITRAGLTNYRNVSLEVIHCDGEICQWHVDGAPAEFVAADERSWTRAASFAIVTALCMDCGQWHTRAAG